MASLATFFLVLLLAASTVYGVDHTVGGSVGWRLDAGDYGFWASIQTFTVGDNLVFNYDSTHGVDIVSEEDYNSCSSSNPIYSFKDGTTRVALSSPGKMYFICPTAGHCSAGMKLAITVVADSNTPGSGIPFTKPAGPPPPPLESDISPVTGTTMSPPFTMYFSGAVSRFDRTTYLMGSLFVSEITFAFLG